MQNISVTIALLYSSITTILSALFTVRTPYFLEGFLFRTDSRPDFSNIFMDACCAWNCDSGKLMVKFYQTLTFRQHKNESLGFIKGGGFVD